MPRLVVCVRVRVRVRVREEAVGGRGRRAGVGVVERCGWVCSVSVSIVSVQVTVGVSRGVCYE